MKRKANHPRIREYLKRHPDGATVAEICEFFGIVGKSKGNVSTTLHLMPDAFIDRWNNKGRLEAIWCLVEVPEDCPRPESYRSKFRSALIKPRIDQKRIDAVQELLKHKYTHAEIMKRVPICRDSIRQIARRAAA